MMKFVWLAEVKTDSTRTRLSFDFIIICMYTLNNVRYNVVSTETSKYPCIVYELSSTDRSKRRELTTVRSTTVENDDCRKLKMLNTLWSLAVYT